MQQKIWYVFRICRVTLTNSETMAPHCTPFYFRCCNFSLVSLASLHTRPSPVCTLQDCFIADVGTKHRGDTVSLYIYIVYMCILKCNRNPDIHLISFNAPKNWISLELYSFQHRAPNGNKEMIYIYLYVFIFVFCSRCCSRPLLH